MNRSIERERNANKHPLSLWRVNKFYMARVTVRSFPWHRQLVIPSRRSAYDVVYIIQLSLCAVSSPPANVFRQRGFPLCNFHPTKANFLFALSPCSSDALTPPHPVSSFSISNIVLRELWKRGIQCAAARRMKSYQPAACYLKLNGFSLWREKTLIHSMHERTEVERNREIPLCIMSRDNEIKKWNRTKRYQMYTWGIESRNNSIDRGENALPIGVTIDDNLPRSMVNHDSTRKIGEIRRERG